MHVRSLIPYIKSKIQWSSNRWCQKCFRLSVCDISHITLITSLNFLDNVEFIVHDYINNCNYTTYINCILDLKIQTTYKIYYQI